MIALGLLLMIKKFNERLPPICYVQISYMFVAIISDNKIDNHFYAKADLQFFEFAVNC